MNNTNVSCVICTLSSYAAPNSEIYQTIQMNNYEEKLLLIFSVFLRCYFLRTFTQHKGYIIREIFKDFDDGF